MLRRGLRADTACAAGSEVADAATKGDRDAVRSLIQRKVDVNAPQVDGTTALHWAVRADDLDLADMLIRAGANVSAANREGVTALQLAAINGSAPMLAEAPQGGRRSERAARPVRGHRADDGLAHREDRRDARLLETGAKVNATETWGGTTALMWAASEHHPGGGQGADRGRRRRQRAVEVRGRRQRPRVRRAHAEGRRGRTEVEDFASGWLTPLMFAAREGDVESARMLVAAGADVNALGRRRQEALGTGDLQRQLRAGVISGRQQSRTSTRRTLSGSRRSTGRSIAATWRRRRTSPGWSPPTRCR